MRFPAFAVHPGEIDAAVRDVQESFAPDVVRIRYSLGENWSGDPSIFFRILVTDDAAHDLDQLQQSAQKLHIALMNAARTDENGLYAYFYFKSESEQARRREPDWE